MKKSKKFKFLINTIPVILFILLMHCCSNDDFINDKNLICPIENGDFNDWLQVSNGDSIFYELPIGWTESIFANVSSRFRNGEGFLNKYVSNSEDGNALLLKRSTQNRNNGFLRFECNSAPNSLSGRYKFLGSSLDGNIDTLTIAVHFSKALDTLSLSNLHQGVIPERAEYIKAFSRTDGMIDFEIDLSNAINKNELEYVTIMLLMESQILLEEEYSTAIIDNLVFE